jgi:S1-C subfamily serine protease
MQAKDIIIDVGGHGVENVTELARALRNFKAGDTVEVKVIRGGRELALTITLDQKPQQAEELQPQATEAQGDDWFSNFPGFGG